METFKKYWQLIIGVVTTVLVVIGWVYDRGRIDSNYEGKIFDTVEQKVETVQHIENSPTPKQVMAKYLRDSINTVHAKRSRAKRDSLWMEEHKARKYTDSINRLNADQLFQIKQELKEIKKQRTVQ